MVKIWLRVELQYQEFDKLQRSLIESKLNDFKKELGNYLMDTSSFDFGDSKHSNKENLYHVMLCGLMASVRSTHYFFSNREAGLGRPDLVLIPKESIPGNLPAVMLEFKSLGQKGKKLSGKDKHAIIEELLEKESLVALEQIFQDHYSALFKQHNYVKEVCFIGIAFCGKQFKMQAREHVPFKAGLLKCGTLDSLDQQIKEMQQAQENFVATQIQDLEMQAAESSSGPSTTLSANSSHTFLYNLSSSASSSSGTTSYEGVEDSGKGKKRKKMGSTSISGTIASEPPIKKLSKQNN